jgi:hypothetical protein
MAHRLAELMHQVETITEPIAQKVAQQECENLILQLWEQRANWPYGGPLEGLMPTLERMLGPKPKYYQWLDGPLDEEGLIGKLIRIHTKELHLLQKILVLQASPETVEISEEWSREYLENLSANEKDILQFFIRVARQEEDDLDEDIQVGEVTEEIKVADESLEIDDESEVVIPSSTERILTAFDILQTQREKIFSSAKPSDKFIKSE